jgi:hypothetical protein
MRRNLFHYQVMSISPSRHLRRNTLVPVGQHCPSEGVLISDNGGTVLEVVGGPPFATVELFAARQCIGSLTLDHLGAGSIAVTELAPASGDSPVPIALRHGRFTLLEGYRRPDRPAECPPGGAP